MCGALGASQAGEAVLPAGRQQRDDGQDRDVLIMVSDEGILHVANVGETHHGDQRNAKIAPGEEQCRARQTAFGFAKGARLLRRRRNERQPPSPIRGVDFPLGVNKRKANRTQAFPR